MTVIKTKYNIFLLLCIAAVTSMFFSCNAVREPEGEFGADDYAELSLLIETSSAARPSATRLIGAAKANEETDKDNDLSDLATIGRGTMIDSLVFAVYDNEGNLLTSLEGADENSQIVKTGSFPMEVKVRLVRGQVYRLAMWAQCSKCKAYNTKNLREVIVNYDNAQNNDETRDAFCAVEVFTVVQSGIRRITLARPFAQINLGMPKESFSAAENIDLTHSAFSISGIDGLATKYDVVAGRASSDDIIDEVMFASAPVPEETLYIGTDRKAHKYLSMSYVLVPDPADTPNATGTYKNLRFVFGANNSTQYETIIEQEVPVRRNWATNIIINNILNQ